MGWTMAAQPLCVPTEPTTKCSPRDYGLSRRLLTWIIGCRSTYLLLCFCPRMSTACVRVCVHTWSRMRACVCVSASVWATVASRQMSLHRRTDSLPLCCSVPSTPTLPSHLPLERRAPMSDFTQWKGLKYIALDQRVHYGPAGVPRGPFLRRVWEQAHGRPLVATRGTQCHTPEFLSQMPAWPWLHPPLPTGSE